MLTSRAGMDLPATDGSSVPAPSLKGLRRRLRLGLRLAQLAIGLGIGLGYSGLGARPAASAEYLHLNFGPLERIVAVEDIEIFAETGEITGTLEPYARYFTPDQLEQARVGLNQTADISAISVSQFLYTAQGKFVLKQLGQVIRTQGRQSGVLGLRAALVLAAADQQGLSLVSVFRAFPTPGIRVDLAQGLAIAEGVNRAINQAETAISLVQQTASQEVASSPTTLPEPAIPITPLLPSGPYGVFRYASVDLPGVDRPVDFYVPERLGAAIAAYNRPLPVVLISHGLGSDRTSYAYLARYLTSHGFAVLSLEHGGSNAGQLGALLEGFSTQVVPTEEFLQRPESASSALDGLANYVAQQPQLSGRIDVETVGVVGQSYGGYTALALAGATFDLAYLSDVCPPDLLSTFNASLLLQCQLLETPNLIPADSAIASEPDFGPDALDTAAAPELTPRFQALLDQDSLADPRIKAVLAINPIGSAIFGPAGYGAIDIPTMIVASSADTIAPALPEQILPFTWLTTRDRYLVLINNGTHFSTIGRSEVGSEALNFPPEVIGPSPILAQQHIQRLSVPFFATHLRQDESSRPFLTAAFAAELSQEPLPLDLIQSLEASALTLPAP
ncbi:MAG: alpha/beta fold hydrolase [Cyanobacteria bacterium P01_D01_bin.128]